MNGLFAAAVDVQTFFATRGWKSAVIGGVAVQRWGDPRQTRDVDMVLLTGVGAEEQFIDPILERYRGRLSDARRFALNNRVVLVQTLAGTPVDISLAGLPYEARVIERSSDFEIGAGQTIATCSAEDLIVLKAFADRIQDWLDIESIIVRQGQRLRRDFVLAELRPLLELKEDLDAEGRVRGLLAKHTSA